MVPLTSPQPHARLNRNFFTRRLRTLIQTDSPSISFTLSLSFTLSHSSSLHLSLLHSLSHSPSLSLTPLHSLTLPRSLSFTFLYSGSLFFTFAHSLSLATIFLYSTFVAALLARVRTQEFAPHLLLAHARLHLCIVERGGRGGGCSSGSGYVLTADSK